MIDRSENATSNPRIACGAATFGEIVEQRLSRRGFLAGAAAMTGAACAPNPMGGRADSRFDFAEIARATGPDIDIPEGYVADLVIGWGDPVLPDRKSTRLNSSHVCSSRMPSSA